MMMTNVIVTINTEAEEGGRSLHYEELHNSLFSQNIFGVIKSRKVR